MVRPEVIRKRLNKLDEYLSILGKLRRYSFEEFIADAERYGSAERFLHLAIESVTDMGNHVIAELELGIVNSYSDIPKIMAETCGQAHHRSGAFHRDDPSFFPGICHGCHPDQA